MTERLSAYNWTRLNIYTEIQLVYIAMVSPEMAESYINIMSFEPDLENLCASIDFYYGTLQEQNEFPLKSTLLAQASRLSKFDQEQIEDCLAEMWKDADIDWTT